MAEGEVLFCENEIFSRFAVCGRVSNQIRVSLCDLSDTEEDTIFKGMR